MRDRATRIRRRGPRRGSRHERLTAWQAADALTQLIFRETLAWTRGNEALAEELRGSAVAAANCIVVGSLAPDQAGFRRELDRAVGKLVRVGAAWALAKDIGPMRPETWGEIEARRDHAERLVRGLYAALGRRVATPAPS